MSGLHKFPPNSNMSKQSFGTEEPIAFYIGEKNLSEILDRGHELISGKVRSAPLSIHFASFLVLQIRSEKNKIK